MIGLFVEKELLQHRWVLGGLLLVCVGLTAALVADLIEKDSFPYGFSIQLRFLWTVIPIAALVLADRLVLGEFRADTHLFLEQLPMSRTLMLTTQYTLGLLLLLMVSCWGYLVSLVYAYRHDVITPLFCLSTFIEGVLYTSFIWSFAFFVSFTGRYRWLVGGVLAFTYLCIAGVSDFALPPLSYLHHARFVLVDKPFPTFSAAFTLVQCSLLYGGALVLGAMVRGRLASWLARPMSLWETLPMTTFVVGLVAMGVVIDIRNDYTAVEPAPDAVVIRTGRTRISLLSAPSEETDAAMRASALRIEAMRKQLGDERFDLVIAQRRLNPDVYKRPVPATVFGFKVQANVAHEDFDHRDFQSWVLEQAIVDRTYGRAEVESRRFLLRGLPVYWSNHFRKKTKRDADPRLMLAARYAAPDGVDDDVLDAALATERRLGPDLYAALAWSGVVALGRERGHDVVRELVSETFVDTGPPDFAITLRDGMKPPNELFEQITGLDRARFIEVWNAFLEGSGVDASDLPRLEASLEPYSESPLTGGLRYSVALTRVPVKRTRVEIRWAEVDPLVFDAPDHDFERVSWSYSEPREGKLGPLWPTGTRLLVEVRVALPELGGLSVSSGLQRVVIP